MLGGGHSYWNFERVDDVAKHDMSCKLVPRPNDSRCKQTVGGIKRQCHIFLPVVWNRRKSVYCSQHLCIYSEFQNNWFASKFLFYLFLFSFYSLKYFVNWKLWAYQAFSSRLLRTPIFCSGHTVQIGTRIYQVHVNNLYSLLKYVLVMYARGARGG